MSSLQLKVWEISVTDSRVQKFAKVLVEHSTRIQPGDRVLIEGTTAAEPLIREVFIRVLEKGGQPHPMVALPGMMPFSQDEMYVTYAKDTQLDFVSTFYKLAYDQFESRIRIHSATNTRGTSSVDPLKVQRRGKALSAITESQFRRGAEGVFKWVTTLYPTEAYAQDAGMSLMDYSDFVFHAVHAHEDDPIAYWKSLEAKQQSAVDFMQGKSQVTLHGPNVDLTLSIKGRKFNNSFGTFNMPDGEIFTGPVEELGQWLGQVHVSRDLWRRGRRRRGVDVQSRTSRNRKGREESGLFAQDDRIRCGFALSWRVRHRHQHRH